MYYLHRFLGMFAGINVLLLAGALFLHTVPKLGAAGARFSTWLCRAPGLDWVVTWFTVMPLFLGPIIHGWAGFLGAVAGQVSSVLIWSNVHEFFHRDAVRGPRIVKVLNKIVGRWQNHAALWLTAIVTPMFWIVRMAEVFIYPLIQRLVRFPAYDQAEWVSVSRQKFTGLVGHDLIWCLYCDWMTGVWSLGTEMLRNVESFWCPIRFDDTGKCTNCTIDFPDLNNGWVEAGGDMKQVAETVERMHSGGHHGWFGHPARVTVKGKDVK
jgi:hypothetical protein